MKTRTGMIIPCGLVAALLLISALVTLPASAAAPGKATLLTPRGIVADTRRPLFTWDAVTGAEWYLVWVGRNGSGYDQKWVSDANWTPPEPLPGGDYSWYVHTWGSGIYGPWSDGADFSIPTRMPGRVTLTSPSGKAASSRPVFTWLPEPDATTYRLWARRNGRPALDETLPAPASDYTHPGRLPDGQYDWWILASSPDGAPDWSDEMSFDLGRPLAPGPIVPLAPVGSITANVPVFEWTEEINTESYYIWLTLNGKHHLDFRVSDDTQWEPEDPLPAGEYRWWIRGENPAANGPWSDATFSLSYPAESSPIPLFPDGADFDCFDQPWVLIWRGDGYTTWVHVQIRRGGQVIVDTWQDLWDAESDATRVSGFPAHFLYFNFENDLGGPGSFTWRLRQYRPGPGTGAWSTWTPFRIEHAGRPPGPPTDLWIDDEFWPLEGRDMFFCSRPRLRWTPPGQATSYDILISSVQNGPEPAGLYEYEGFFEEGWLDEAMLLYEMVPATYRFTIRAHNRYGSAQAVSPEFRVAGMNFSGGPPNGGMPFMGDVRLERIGHKVQLSAEIMRNIFLYRAYVARNGVTVLDRWIDLDDEPGSIRNGRFEVPLPGSAAPGHYACWGQAYHEPTGVGNWKPGNALVVEDLVTPVPLSPAGLVNGARPAFEWQDDEHADGHRLYVTRDGNRYFDWELWPASEYDQTEETNSFSEVGSPEGWHGLYDSWQANLPFGFPFYGNVYTQVFIRGHGLLAFEALTENGDIILDDDLSTTPSISVFDALWTTAGPGCDIFTDASPDAFTVRWVARYGADAASDPYLLVKLAESIRNTLPAEDLQAHFSVTLYPDGRIRFRYGPGNELEGVIGIRAGDRTRRHICDDASGMSMRYAPDILLSPYPVGHAMFESYWDLPNGTYAWWLQSFREGADQSAWARGDDFIIDHHAP